MTSRRIGEPNPRLKFTNPNLKIKESTMTFKPANLAVNPGGHPAVVVPTRPPNLREITRGWIADRVVDDRNGEEVEFEELLADCHDWCERYGYETPHFSTVGRMLGERPHHSVRIRSVKTTMVSGVRLR